MNEAQAVMDIAISINAHFRFGVDSIDMFFEGQERTAPQKPLWVEVLRFGPFFNYRLNDDIIITFQVQINCFAQDTANIYGSTRIAADFAKRACEPMYFEYLDDCANCQNLQVLEKGRIEQRGEILTTVVRADYSLVVPKRGV